MNSQFFPPPEGQPNESSSGEMFFCILNFCAPENRYQFVTSDEHFEAFRAEQFMLNFAERQRVNCFGLKHKAALKLRYPWPSQQYTAAD